MDTRLLRHPLERPLFAGFAVLNVLILAAVAFIAIQGADWLSAHPFLAKYSLHLRTIATAALLGPFTTTFLRNIRRAEVRGKSLPVSPQQLPQIYEIFLGHCGRLGLDPPELYFSDSAIKEPARAYMSWKKEYIVLSTAFLQPDLKPMLPLFSFLLARELGRLRLGHASWPHDLLLAYIQKIPYLRNPLLRVFTYSEDRWGAYLAPEGLPALAGLAAGRRMLPVIDVGNYLRHARSYGGFWASAAELMAETPSVARRINALVDAGLFRIEADSHDGAGAQVI